MSEESLEPATPTPPPPPPNGGLKAWLQVLGAHFLFFNSWGLVNTFGVFQNFYEDSLLTTQSESNISWIGTFQAFLLVALSLFVGPLFDRGYIHLLIICGSFLIVFGMMMTSISTNYWQIFLSQGLCVGIGTGLNFLPSLAIVATYFTTKRSLAIGVVASGGSIGSVIYPIVFERLEPRIGFPWAVRVMGFIALATLSISIATLRPRLPPPKKARALLDPAAFKNISFVLFSVGMFLVFIGLYVPIFYIISWAQVHIHTERDLSFYMLSVLNGASVFGRIIPGLLADRFGAPLGLMVVNCAVAGILAFVAIAIHDLGGLVVFAIMYGFVSGAVVSLPGTVLATLAPSLDRVGTWMGMALCFAALGLLIGNPIAGVIIHVPEDQFRGGFIFSGSFVLAAAATFGLVLFVKRDITQEEK